MKIQNIFYKVHTYNLKNINIGIDINYLKDEEKKLKHSQHYSFSQLLIQNKAIKKGSGKKTTIELYVLPPYSPKQNGRVEAQNPSLCRLAENKT